MFLYGVQAAGELLKPAETARGFTQTVQICLRPFFLFRIYRDNGRAFLPKFPDREKVIHREPFGNCRSV
jgi:hypothetical protein